RPATCSGAAVRLAALSCAAMLLRAPDRRQKTSTMLVTISRPRFMPLAADGCGNAAMPSGSVRADLRCTVSWPILGVWLECIDAPVLVFTDAHLQQDKKYPRSRPGNATSIRKTTLNRKFSQYF